MATLENRIATLEQVRYKDCINVFIRRFLDDGLGTVSAIHGDRKWIKHPDETMDDFERRATADAQEMPLDGAVRVFELQWPQTVPECDA